MSLDSGREDLGLWDAAEDQEEPPNKVLDDVALSRELPLILQTGVMFLGHKKVQAYHRISMIT